MLMLIKNLTSGLSIEKLHTDGMNFSSINFSFKNLKLNRLKSSQQMKTLKLMTFERDVVSSWKTSISQL